MSTETNKAPQLPDTSGWIKRAPGDVIEAGTPWMYVAKDGKSFAVNTHDAGEIHAVGSGTYWTPPPVEPAPWERISTDRERPTLARIVWGDDVGEFAGEQTAKVYVEGDKILDEWDELIGKTARVTSVELLHTYSPVTHVPVERALIDEAVPWAAYWRSGGTAPESSASGIVRSLAALADKPTDD